MKRVNFLFVALIIAALGAGCKGTPEPLPPPPPPSQPESINEPMPEDVRWAWGQAKLSDEALAMKTAGTRATEQLARQISQDVRGLLEDYTMIAGLADDAVSIMHIESISKNLVNVNLTGVIINWQERMPDGTWYVRVEVANAEIKNAVNRIYDNETFNYAEWKKDEALRRMDSMLRERMPPPVYSEG